MRNRFATLISFVFMAFGVISIVWVGSSLSGRAFSQTHQPVPTPVPGGSLPPQAQPQQNFPPPAMNVPPQTPPQGQPQGQQPPPPVQPQQVPPPQQMQVPPAGNLPPPDMAMPESGNYDDSQQGDQGGQGDQGDPNAQMNPPGVTEGQPLLPGFNPEGYTYDPTGRRDPFMPFGASSVIPQPLPVGGPSVPVVLNPPNENSLVFFELGQLKVVAIVWDVKDPKAMVMDPKGKLHMVHKDSPIGRNNGFVYAIREGEIVVIEPTLSETGAQTAASRVMYLTK